MTVYQRKQSVILYQDYEEWGVLFDREDGASLVINLVGIVIWQALEEPCGEDGLISVVRDVFEDVPEELAGDVGEFVAGLVEKSFIAVYESGACQNPRER